MALVEGSYDPFGVGTGPTGGWWGGASAGLGALGDLYTAYQNMQAREQQKKLYDIQSSPSKMAEYINKLYQPMTAQVADAIRRQMIAPNWAAMTGGATGGALNQFIADALAKIEAQRYGEAQHTALGALGGAGSQIPGQQQGGMLGNILKNLGVLKQIGQPQQRGLTDFGAGAGNVTNWGGDWGLPTTVAPDVNVMGGVF